MRQRSPEFHLPQGELGFPVVFLDHSLGGIGSPVGVEIQFARIGILRTAPGFLFFEKVQGISLTDPGHALQILLPFQVFDVVSGGAASAVAVAEGDQEGIQGPDLGPVFPDVVHALRIRLIGVACGQEGRDFGAVDPLPGKVMIGETFPVVIGPEDLLGDQVIYTAFLKNLRQGTAVSESVRKPEDPAFRTQDVFIVIQAVQKLADQGFPAGHIGIRLDPHGAFGDPSAFFNGFFDPFKKLRSIFAAHLIGSRLALEEIIIRIFFQEPQLGCKGPYRLSFRFSHGPEPGHIQMRISHSEKVRRRTAVNRREGGLQHFPGCPVGSVPFGFSLFKIRRQGKLLQGFGQLRGTQR